MNKISVIKPPFVTSVNPNEIVPRRGPPPPSVDYNESDGKVNQFYIAIFGNSYKGILPIIRFSYSAVFYLTRVSKPKTALKFHLHGFFTKKKKKKKKKKILSLICKKKNPHLIIRLCFHCKILITFGNAAFLA
jgi:hypothetical protein